MRNCKGYVYLELMAAFSVCIFLVLSILPILEELMTHRERYCRKDRSPPFTI
ncbi:hypothetical protein RCO48_06105 [Peribacillus frigoritolerans]|nr:hypothetical protein [Peribacillus frigoritolerans]